MHMSILRLVLSIVSLTLVFMMSTPGFSQEISSAIEAAQNAQLLSNPTALNLPILAISSIERNPVAQDLSEESILVRHAREACQYLGFRDEFAFTILNSSQSTQVAELFGVGGPMAYTEAVSAGVELATFTSLTCVKKSTSTQAASEPFKISTPTFLGHVFAAYDSIENLNAQSKTERGLLSVANALKLCQLLGYASVESFSIKENVEAVLAWGHLMSSQLELITQQQLMWDGHVYQHASFSQITCSQTNL